MVNMRKEGEFYFIFIRLVTCVSDALIVEREIAEKMDQLVQERVSECLKTHIPQELQDEVARSKMELKQVRLELHNSYVGLTYSFN